MSEPINLTAEADRLTRALGGTWHGSSGMACCPAHDDRSSSLSISPGRTTILLHCFAGCEFIDIIRAARGSGALRGTSKSSDRADRPAPNTDYAPLARKIWADAGSLSGTRGERYMLARGVVGPWNELRYHPRTPFGAGSMVTFRPALIGAVRDDSGLIAIHRIALDPRTGGKATDLKSPKLTLGRPKSGAVRLFKGGRTLGLAEGIETAKSAAHMLGIPVWAALGTERFAMVDIPSDVTRLILLADRGVGGRRAVILGRKGHARPGRSIETPLPPNGFDDWNEADQARQGLPRT